MVTTIQYSFMAVYDSQAVRKLPSTGHLNYYKHNPELPHTP